MDSKASSLAKVIRGELERMSADLKVEEVGRVVQIGDGVARIWGLDSCVYGELLDFEGGVQGMAMSLETDTVGCVILGDSSALAAGSTVRRTGKAVEVPVGDAMLGRVVDPLGFPLDGKGPIAASGRRPVESEAPGIMERQGVREPMETGILAIDSMVPIGRGQRELIIGDRQTGKTTIAVDAIINQKGKGVLCVYVAIGQKASSVAGIVGLLERKGAMDYTVVVSAPASVSAPLQYLAPYAGCAIAEEFMKSGGRDVLIVYDDLSKHAVAYRAMSLLLKRPPGREAYPGDVFYLHSRLLERSARLADSMGGGSITALPIIETLSGDVSAYIPTNVISITDGQIYLEGELFYAGVRPAVNVGLSVSRVGGSAQTKAIKKVAGSLRMNLAQYRELAVFARFGSDLDKATLERLAHGERLVECLKQAQHEPLSMAEQALVLYVAVNKYVMQVPVKHVKSFNRDLLAFFHGKQGELLRRIGESGDIDAATEAELRKAVDEFLLTI